MGRFVKVKANKLSISNRKPVFGVGINDADYKIEVDGIRCKFYSTWKSMLSRCYSKKYQKRQPTYIDCSVCDEWLTFSNFRSWMKLQDWSGKELDKDVRVIGNKIYSPITCAFVSKEVNRLLEDRGNSRGPYPLGVFFQKDINRFRAKCNRNGKSISLGCYGSPEEASHAYNRFKSGEIRRIANLEDDPIVKKGLLMHAELRLNS